MNALVHSEISWLPEPLGTFITRVRLETLVGSLMAAEAGRVREHLSTLRAEERLLPRVSAEVRLVGGQLGEAFATLLALVWFILGVNPLMAGERGGARESFAAIGAQVWFFSCVRALVVFQILQLCVCFPTFVTSIRTMSLMVSPVFPEHRGVRKALTTFSAEVRLLPSVRSHVHFKLRQGGVAFRALTARIRTFTTVLCHVNLQTYRLHKGLPTLCAYKGFLPSVRAAMVAQLCGRLVSLVTVWTLKGTLG